MRLKASRVKSVCVIVVCLISSIICLLGHQARVAADRLFGNLTYLTSCPYIAKHVTLVNGYRIVWNDHLHVSLSYEGRYVYGDWNHDGLKDAAVVIDESQGGSDDEFCLAFLINNGTRLVHRQSAYLDDSAIIRSVKTHGDYVIVDMFVHQKGDCHAGPTQHVRYRYEYSGRGQWVEGTLVNILPSRKLRAS